MTAGNRSNEGPLRLLSLDGGGIRGLSELLIIKELMERVKSVKRLTKTPRPCDYFDMIGGTSTGGLIALMLGRLEMDTDTAISEYVKFAERVFSKEKRHPTRHGRFRATALRQAFEEVIKKKDGDGLMRSAKSDLGLQCKTFVCATPALNMASPRIFRSYDVPENQSANCTIWEAARATSAAPTFFKPVYIGELGVPEKFIDGGLCCNNPIKQLVEEAKLVFGELRLGQAACIVSIGTGYPKPTGLGKSTCLDKIIPISLINVLRNIATDCETAAEDHERLHRGKIPKVYFRFNVQQGLQEVLLDEWKQMGVVTTHTKTYLDSSEVGEQMNKVRDILHESFVIVEAHEEPQLR